MQTVLMTGAAGGVGTRLRPLLRGLYPKLLLSDLQPPSDLDPDEAFTAADLADAEATRRLCQGVDGIIHLGGYSVEGPWEAIHQANIVGLYNLYEAARVNRVRRVIFASSNHAVGFYRRDTPIDAERRVRPDSRYGVSKAFGEALAALYADKYGVQTLSIRIGNVDDKPVDRRRLAIWLHPEDLLQLVRIGLEHPEIHCEVVYGASANERSWWNNEAAFRLGYRPRHHAEDHVEHALAAQAKLPADPIGDRYQGGTFCSLEYAREAEPEA